jgi:hypothetical protein
VWDTSGRLSTLPAIQLARAPFSASLSLSTLHYNDTVLLSLAAKPDFFPAPVATRIKFSRLALSQVCLANPDIFSSQGVADFATGSAPVRLLQLPGCSGNYAVTLTHVGCHRNNSSNYEGNVAVLHSPAVTPLLTCPTGCTWAPGSPLALSFEMSDAPFAAATAALTITGTQTSTELTGVGQTFPVSGGVADLGRLFPTRAAATAAWAVFPQSDARSIRLNTPGGVASSDCVVGLQPPPMSVTVGGTAASWHAGGPPTLYAGTPLSVVWTSGATCAAGSVSLDLMRGGAPLLSVAAAPAAAGAYAWTLPSAVFATAGEKRRRRVHRASGLQRRRAARHLPRLCRGRHAAGAHAQRGHAAVAGAHRDGYVGRAPGPHLALSLTASAPGSAPVTIAASIPATARSFTWSITDGQVAALTSVANWALGALALSTAAAPGAARISVTYPLTPGSIPPPSPDFTALGFTEYTHPRARWRPLRGVL